MNNKLEISKCKKLIGNYMNKELIGAGLKARRKERKITQRDLATMLNVKDDTIRNVEKGVSYISLKRLMQVCEALDMEVTVTPIKRVKSA
ncbi:helix-turn-helix domain-containing protein [Mucilaginibacter sp. UYCu711]|uniref:helix-turn-helix domain-containing protein n=1 Tax=Mucilaginibacter sp. UYCu711 TaxID=3156339 RepID=UPI003D260184